MNTARLQAQSRAKTLTQGTGMFMVAAMFFGFITSNSQVMSIGVGLAIVCGLFTSYRNYLSSAGEDVADSKLTMIHFVTRDWSGVAWISAVLIAVIASSIYGVQVQIR